MTRHFVWLVPLVNLVLFLGLGLVLVLAMRLWPRRARWWSSAADRRRGHPAGAGAGRSEDLPGSMVTGRAGGGVSASPRCWNGSRLWRRWLAWSLPVLLGLVLLQAGWIFGGDRIKQWREDGRPLPPAGSPNVLLIVLDTVRADHLSLYGYPRPPRPLWSGWPRGESALIRRAHPRPGRSPRTPASSPAAGPMSSACNG